MSNTNLLRQSDEQVVAVHLGDDGKNTFFSILGGWVPSCNVAWLGKKVDIFDKLCELPNWDEIGHRVVFLNTEELQEFLQESEQAA